MRTMIVQLTMMISIYIFPDPKLEVVVSKIKVVAHEISNG